MKSKVEMHSLPVPRVFGERKMFHYDRTRLNNTRASSDTAFRQRVVEQNAGASKKMRRLL
jgi:hypothetical protein